VLGGWRGERRQRDIGELGIGQHRAVELIGAREIEECALSSPVPYEDATIDADEERLN
jgi:hypothetical protein